MGGTFFLTPRQKYRLMVLEMIEKANDLDVRGDAQGFWKVTRNMVPLLLRYMQPDVKKKVGEILDEVETKEKKIKENKSLSPTEKEARLKDMYYKHAQDLYAWLVFTATHSPIIGQDVEGAILMDVNTIEDLKEEARKIREATTKLEVFESGGTPGDAQD